MFKPGADLGEGGGAAGVDCFLSGIRPPADPKGPPLILLTSPVLADQPLIFSMSPRCVRCTWFNVI